MRATLSRRLLQRAWQMVGKFQSQKGQSRVLVILPMQTSLKVELYRLLTRENVTRAELMRRLNWKRESVDRLFRLNHATRLEQFDAAFRALGHRVEISVHY